MEYKPSYYNLVVDHGPWRLLFNGVSSGLMRLPQDMADEIQPFLGANRSRDAGLGLDQWKFPTFLKCDLPNWAQARFSAFCDGQYFVPIEHDEQKLLRQRYERDRRQSPFLVTITTTMDCNLGCYYCYEDKSSQYLSRDGCDAILHWIRGEHQSKRHEKLYVDWYGGEPMLNQDAIDYLSSHAIAYCESNGLEYAASMISNGTQWPTDARDFVKRNRIRQLQLTLDGPQSAHDKRRIYVDKQKRPDGTFETILDTVENLLGSLTIHLRVNVDPWVGRSALDLVDVFAERGWLKPENNFFPYLAVISPMTEHCGFLKKSKDVVEFHDEFDRINHEFQRRIAAQMGARSMQHVQYYPSSVRINCGAVGDNSMIFGPDGKMYKCGLEVGDEERAHDDLCLSGELAAPSSGANELLPVLSTPPKKWSPNRWDAFDPFSHERCSKCQYLPVCMGGCPKSHMDQDEFHLKSQSEYWENNFDVIIRSYYDATYDASKS